MQNQNPLDQSVVDAAQRTLSGTVGSEIDISEAKNKLVHITSNIARLEWVKGAFGKLLGNELKRMYKMQAALVSTIKFKSITALESEYHDKWPRYYRAVVPRVLTIESAVKHFDDLAGEIADHNKALEE